MKRSNEYAREAMSHIDAPKTVWAALALSLEMRLSSDNAREAIGLLRGEWDLMHRSGLIPQKPSKPRLGRGVR